jgi:pimeloyl-ACP methyl ester carboxylesterase
MLPSCRPLLQTLASQLHLPTRPLSTSGYLTPTDRPQPDSQVFHLPSSRTLGFAEYGAPTGSPLFFFHGLPSSRLECAEWAPIALKHNVRLIGVDRPGMGLSSFQPGRKILDWPADVLRLADHLQIGEFRVIGSSGGGPYSLACAYALPRDRLKGAGVLAGVGPWHQGTKDTLLIGRVVWNIWAWAPWTFRAIYDRTAVPAARDPDPERLNKIWGQAMERMREKDRRVFEDETVRNLTVEAFRAAFIRGAEGGAHEVRLVTRGWGFECEDVGFEGVKLWYGDEDTNTPVTVGRYMAERLKGSKLKVYPGETHMTLTAAERAEEILKAMMDIE